MCVHVCVEIINTKEESIIWYVSRVFVAVHRGNPHMCFLYNGDCSPACSGARYKLDHCKRALTDIDARGKIKRARDFPKGI